MKLKFPALILAAALLLSFTGCEGFIRIDPAPPSSSESSESSEPPSSSESSESSEQAFPAPTQAEAEALIERELFVLWGKKNLDGLTNSEKLWVALTLCGEEGILYEPKDPAWRGVQTVAFSEDGLRRAFEDSCLAATGVTLTDFEAGGVGYVYAPEDHLFYEAGAKGFYMPEAVYSRVVSAEASGDTLIYKVKKLWVCDWPGDYDFSCVFGSYSDALDGCETGENSLFSVEIDMEADGDWYEARNGAAAAEAEARWDEYGDRAETYTFVFRNAGGRILLEDFTAG